MINIKFLNNVQISTSLLLLSFGFIFLTSSIAGWFYWFQYRPTKIRQECHLKAVEEAKDIYRSGVYDPPGEPTEFEKIAVKDGRYIRDTYSGHYEICLHEKGLK